MKRVLQTAFLNVSQSERIFLTSIGNFNENPIQLFLHNIFITNLNKLSISIPISFIIITYPVVVMVFSNIFLNIIYIQTFNFIELHGHIPSWWKGTCDK